MTAVWFAPPARGSQTRFGAQVGLVVADQDYTYREVEFNFNPRSSLGATIGLYVDRDLTPVLSGRLQLLYVRKGSEVKLFNTEYDFGYGIVDDSVRLKDEIDYLSVVPMLRLVGPLGPGRPYLMAGPRLDVRLNGNLDLNTLASDKLESLIWGATAAVGYEVPLSEWRRLSVEVHYHHDFSDAYDLTKLSVRNRAVIVLVGMTI